MAVRTPPFLLRLRVQNFRSLRSVDVRLQPVSVLVGPNGAGKSNLLDVIAFLGDSVREDLGPAILRRGGFDRVRFRGDRVARGVTIAIEAAVTKNSSRNATDDYTLSFDVRELRRRREGSAGTQYLRRQETFAFKRTPGAGRRITIEGGDVSFITGDEETSTVSLREDSLGLATLPRLGPDQGGEQVQAVANLFAGFRVFDVDVHAARQPSEAESSAKLSNNAANLAAFLHYMSGEHSESFERLQEDAREFIPGLKELHFQTTGGATSATVLKLKEQGLRGDTDFADASFGSVRALALLGLLYDPDPPRLTCIEEIDHGLHPYVLDRLVELIRQASKKTQFLIATHSPPLVNRLNSSELIVCERGENGSSNIPAIDPEKVRLMEREVEGELGLGELWFTGALGGVPA